MSGHPITFVQSRRETGLLPPPVRGFAGRWRILGLDSFNDYAKKVSKFKIELREKPSRPEAANSPMPENTSAIAPPLPTAVPVVDVIPKDVSTLRPRKKKKPEASQRPSQFTFHVNQGPYCYYSGRFTPEEDQKLLRLHAEYHDDWLEISTRFGPDRSTKALRARYSYIAYALQQAALADTASSVAIPPAEEPIFSNDSDSSSLHEEDFPHLNQTNLEVIDLTQDDSTPESDAAETLLSLVCPRGVMTEIALT
jgi:hypothetical protein